MSPGEIGRPVRLVSWNVRDLTGDAAAVRAVLRLLAPDVVCLQEAPRRPGGRRRIRALATELGLRHVAGGRDSGGTALLVGPEVRVDAAVAVRLPVPHWYTRTRGAVAARVHTGPGAGTVRAPSVALAVACLHLPLDGEQRLEHARSVRALVAAHLPAPGAVVVAGDFNEPAGSPAWRTFDVLTSDPAPRAAATYPAHRPGARIDAVLVGAGLAVTEYGDGGVSPALAARASDHLPVLAVLAPVRR